MVKTPSNLAIFAFVFAAICLAGAILFVSIENSRLDRVIYNLRVGNQQLESDYLQMRDERLASNAMMENLARRVDARLSEIGDELSAFGSADAQSAMSTAWLHLTSGTAGDLGKSDALNYIAARETVFSRLNLSCPALDATGESCPGRIYLFNITLNDPYFEFVDFQWADLRGWTMTSPKFSHAKLQNGIFSFWRVQGGALEHVDARGSRWSDLALTDVSLSQSDFSNVTIKGGRFTGGRIWRTKFDNSLFEYVRLDGVSLTDVSFRNVGLSGTKFENVDIGDDVDFSNAWAWADQMPTGLDPALITQCTWTPRMMGSSPVRGDPRPADC